MIGIDEVGRGALAGPLVVAGCYFTENPGFIRGLNDSKKLSKKTRARLDGDIKSGTLYAIIFVPPEEVDAHGLTACIRKATIQIVSQLPQEAEIILDGKYNFLRGTPNEHRTKVVKHADGLYPSVMAASVIAKVARDKLMEGYAKQYPEYGFERHVGYGTAAHLDALEKFGISPIHRRSVAPVKRLIK